MGVVQSRSVMRSGGATRIVHKVHTAKRLASSIPPVDQSGNLDVAGVPAQTEALAFGFEDIGEPKTTEFRRFLTQGGGKISSWHDVPLRSPSGNLHVVIEIPRMTSAKMEMATKEVSTPIKQDTKKGRLRDYSIPIEWNYGAFPQTWEQPDHAWAGLEELASRGDNDPLDVVDLSQTAVECGSVIEVKPIGVLAMIDEGEVDWKVIVINTDDPKAQLINSLGDAETHFPGQVARVREWFTWYKAVDGAPGNGPLGSNLKADSDPNVFGFDGEAKDAAKALEVVEETHAAWKALKTGAVPADGLALE